MDIHIGTSGWSYDHWKEKFYPASMKSSEWLSFYAEEFNSVEVNMSFYRWPTDELLEGWSARTPSGFKFSMKAPRTITHYGRLEDAKIQVKDFYDVTSSLGRKTGCHLFQLPPSFDRTDENIGSLRDFLEILDARRDNTIEFRHKSWWSEDIYELLEKNGIGFCTVSGLGMPKEIVCTSGIFYSRFHGDMYSTEYPFDSLKKYAKAINGLGADKVYIYFNNDTNAFAPKNAEMMKNILLEA